MIRALDTALAIACRPIGMRDAYAYAATEVGNIVARMNESTNAEALARVTASAVWGTLRKAPLDERESGDCCSVEYGCR
jgi:hypothetical protein